jgi:hypothetical protein
VIEVITYAECVMRVDSAANYEREVKEAFASMSSVIVADEIVSISEPVPDAKKRAYETKVLARFVLNIQEHPEHRKNVEEYVSDIVPFLKRFVPRCQSVVSTKIVQMKRMLESEQ